MRTSFRWFTVVVLSAFAVLPAPLQAQAQVQSSNLPRGNGVARAARPAPRSVVTAPSFHPAPIRSVNRPAFNAVQIQNFNGTQRFASIGMRPRPTFRPPQRFVAANSGNRQSATVSGTLNLNLATNRVANGNPAPQGTSGNQRFAQTNNANRGSDNLQDHVFARRSGSWHPDWDHNRDHWWNGHLCHFVNNVWIIFDVGYYPWWLYGYPSDYGYYPYSYSPNGYDPYGYQYGSDSGYYTEGQNGDGYSENGQYEDQGDASNTTPDQDLATETVAAVRTS